MNGFNTILVCTLISFQSFGQLTVDRKYLKTALRSHLHLGDSSFSRGEFLTAEKHYNEAFMHLQKLLQLKSSIRIGLHKETIFDPIDRLGRLYIQANNLKKAEEYFEYSREIREKELPRFSLFRIPPLVGLSEIYYLKGDYRKAKEYLDQAEWQFYRSTTGWYNYDHYSKAIFRNQFEIALKEHNYANAERYLGLLSSGSTITGDKNVQTNIPRVFDMRARYFLHFGDYEEAERNLKKAELFANAIDNELVNFQIKKTRTLLQWSVGDIRAAAQTLIDLTQSYKEYIQENFAAMTEFEREAFFEKLRSDFELLNSFAIHNMDHEISDELLKQVYNNQLFSKALLLNHLNKQKEQILLSGDNQLIKLLDEWEAEKANLSMLYYQKKPDDALIATTEQRIQQLEQQINSESNILNSMEEDIIWEDVRRSLTEGEAAIEIIRVRDYNLPGKEGAQVSAYQFTDFYSYLVLVIARDLKSPQALVLENGNDMDSRDVNIYRKSIQFKVEDRASYNAYWKPLLKLLGTYNKLFISADGVYNQINLNSLQNPITGKYVLEETDLIFVTNTKDLVETSSLADSKNAALFARPQYVSSQTQEIDFMTNTEFRNLEADVFENFREQLFSDLPGTEKEVKSIEMLLGEREWKVASSYHKEASEKALRSVDNPAILHIATHGFFLQEDNLDGVNSMIRSGIILAGVDKVDAPPHNDGILTAYEATNLRLDSTYLVVLSACETGLGEVKNGEGVYGLQRGLKVAGARFILMSLWKVDDFATQELMENFYVNWLLGTPIHEAFKKAQIGLRDKYPHPFYWGAFILLGS